MTRSGKATSLFLHPLAWGLGLVLGWASSAAAQETVWIEGEPDSTVLSTVLDEEIRVIEQAPAQPTKLSSPKLTEPVPINRASFAGEVVDPSASTMITDQSGQAAASAFQMNGVGSGSVFAGPQGFGGRLFGGSTSGLFNDVSAGIFSNPNQTVYNGGTTLRLMEGESWAVMTRGLVGIVDNYALSNTSTAFSIDTYAGTRIRSYGGGEHWLKVGGFVDDQNQFGKAGPMFGALLFANEAFPVTVDAAVGFGYGKDVDRLPRSSEIVDVADRDYQVRVGTFLSPTMQVGVTTMIADWEGGTDNRSWSVGAFTNFLAFQRSFVRLDLSAGDEGVRGYAMLSYLFGPAPMRAASCGECRVDGMSWLKQPVNRDVALQMRSQQISLVDRLLVRARVVIPPRQAIGNDLNSNGIVDAGDTFELDIIATNGTVVTLNSVSIGQNPTISGTAGATPQGISGGTFNNVAPGQTVQTDQSSDINVDVSNTAAPASTIFVTCDVTTEGQTRRVTFGPITVGSTANGQEYSSN